MSGRDDDLSSRRKTTRHPILSAIIDALAWLRHSNEIVGHIITHL